LGLLDNVGLVLRSRPGHPAEDSHAGKVGGLRGHRWLLFAVESKVVIHDMVSGAAREAVRTLWDGKAPTALAFLYANAARLLGFLAGDNANEVILGPVLAVGHSGGSIALINLTTLQVSESRHHVNRDAHVSERTSFHLADHHCRGLMQPWRQQRADGHPLAVQVYAKLAGGHKGAVTGMLPLGSKEPAGPDRLVTAAADGTVAVWEPSLATPSSVHAPVATWKAHDGPVSSLTFFRHLTDTPEQPQLRLATSGAGSVTSCPECLASAQDTYRTGCRWLKPSALWDTMQARRRTGGYAFGTQASGSQQGPQSLWPRAQWPRCCSAAMVRRPLGTSRACCWCPRCSYLENTCPTWSPVISDAPLAMQPPCK
jgi:hypothetical protein